MFGFTLPIAEPFFLMLFGLLFLAAATGLQIKLAKKLKKRRTED
jgi:hypothetical protein